MRMLQHHARRIIRLCLLAFTMTPLTNSAQQEKAAPETAFWREQHAHAVGMVAYAYALPYLYFANLRWAWITREPKPDAESPERRDVPISDELRKNPLAEIEDPLADWRTINRMLKENPPPARDAALLKLFANVNIGPDQDVDALDEDSKRGLVRAMKDGRRLLREANEEGPDAKEVNGWIYYPNLGRLGKYGDYLSPAAIQSLSGHVTNAPQEATYLNGILDNEGQPLNGANRYELHFPSGGEPEAEAFWSLILYSTDFNLVDNPIDRYSIGDRTPDLQRDEGGGLTLYIQHESPGEDKASNWLPTPPPGEGFSMILRAYIPGDELVKQTWEPPAVTKVE